MSTFGIANASSMPTTDLKIFAREEILQAIDDMITEKNSDPLTRLQSDEETMFRKERDRVAKFLKLPLKYNT